MAKSSKLEYASRVEHLTPEEAERLQSRMPDKLAGRLLKNKLSKARAMALQLEREDKRLLKWRKAAEKARKKAEAAQQAKAAKKAKALAKAKAKTAKKKQAAKTKAAAQPRTRAKPNARKPGAARKTRASAKA
jgi:hypothetical protein